MILVRVAIVASTIITLGHVAAINISLWVQVFIFWPKHPPPCHVPSAFLSNYWELSGHLSGNRHLLERCKSAKNSPRVMSVNVTVTKTNLTCLSVICYRALAGWGLFFGQETNTGTHREMPSDSI